MFFKPKSQSIPDPATLTEDERRSKQIVFWWKQWKLIKSDHDEQYAMPFIGILHRILTKIGNDKIENHNKFKLAVLRRNFAINLKNHGGFFDWCRNQPLPEPLTAEEKADQSITGSQSAFDSWTDMPWDAATAPPEDFLTRFKPRTPEACVSGNIKSYGDDLAAARAALKEESRRAQQAPQAAAEKAERERQAKEKDRRQEQARQEQEKQHREARRTDDQIAHYLHILELEEGAGQRAVKYRFHQLSAKLHPDKGGSNYFQKQLIEARDYLLKHLHDEGPDWIPSGEKARMQEEPVRLAEQKAKEEPASSGYADYMANKRAMNKPPPTKQTEKPESAPKQELPPKREKVSKVVQLDKKTKNYNPQVEAARNDWKLPKLFTARIVESRYLVMIDNAKPAEFARINDQYELLMEAAA